ncbi:MAG: extracellular solute-binding protein [Spirochaetaceae bacterium]|jgi:multiple sugar transport system substrate-binding protein|nr:extracellular solute-binding protein [Spirochaetaceae bacterium]
MKKFDIVIICAALVVFVLAVFFYPSKKINFSQTTLVFSQWLNDDMDQEVLGKIIDEFEKSHPGINIVLENRNYRNLKTDCAGYLDIMRGGGAGGNENKKDTHKFPDIITVDPLWFDDSEKRILFANQNGGETRESTATNEVYTRPLYSYFNALFYNIKILEDAGFDRPPKTRAEFADVCLKLKEKNIYGLSVSGDFFADIFPWIWSEAGTKTLQTINGEKDKFDFTEKNVVGSMDFFYKLNSQNTLGRPPFIKDDDEKINNFTAGKTAMITASSKLVKKLKTQHKDTRFGITNIPYPENYSGRPIFSMNCVHAAVLSSSSYSEAAFEFVEFIGAANAVLAAAAGATSDDTASSVFGGVLTDNLSPGERNGTPLDTIQAKAQSMIESAESVDDWKLFSACASLGSIAAEEINLMFRYKQGAADTAETIKNRYNSVVK